jgi:hypothetical protein
MINLTGQVDEVQAIAKTTSFHKMESEDFVAAGLKFKNGAVGSLMASTSSYPGYPESIVLNCEKGSVKLESGTLKINWQNNEVEEFGETSGTGGSADPMAFPFDWHKSLIKNFALSLNDNKSTIVSGEEASIKVCTFNASSPETIVDLLSFKESAKFFIRLLCQSNGNAIGSALPPVPEVSPNSSILLFCHWIIKVPDSNLADPFSQFNIIDSGYPGYVEVLAIREPIAPFLNLNAPETKSSASII